MDAKYVLTKSQSDDLYKLMKFMHNTFIKFKIPYFICGGTLLGAIRHQGIIPHDDDGDVCIFKKDVPKLKKLIDYFDKHGFILEEGLEEEDDEGNIKKNACQRVKNSCTWFVSGKKEESLGCDIFIMEVDKGGKVNYADPYWKTADNGGKKCYFLLDHIFPLIPYRYGNYYLYGPRNAILHLNTCYGPDWNSMGQTLYDHRTGKWTRGKKNKLKADDFLTLEPPTSTADNKVQSVLCDTKKKSCGTYRKSLRKSAKKSRGKKSYKSNKKSKK